MAKKTAKKNQQNKTQKTAIVDNTVITITVPVEEATEAYNKTLQQLKQNVSAPGFRKGKVPSKIAEEQLGEQNIIERALQLVVPKRFETAMKKSDYKPLTQPEFKPVKLEKGSEWVIEAHIAEKPSVTLKGYKKVVKQAKKDADKHLEEQLKEAKKAQEKAKKAAEKTGEDAKKPPQQEVKEPTDEQRQNHELQHIYQALVDEVGPDIPELLVKEEVRYEINKLAKKLEGMNMKVEDFIKHQGITFEQLSSQFAAEALGRLQLTFVLDAIAEKEELAVSKKEIDEQVDKIEDENIREQQREDTQYRALVEQTLKRKKVSEYITSI